MTSVSPVAVVAVTVGSHHTQSNGHINTKYPSCVLPEVTVPGDINVDGTAATAHPPTTSPTTTSTLWTVGVAVYYSRWKNLMTSVLMAVFTPTLHHINTLYYSR